jgi:hypothetical protein
MLRLVGRSTGSGIAMEETDAHLFVFRDGRIAAGTTSRTEPKPSKPPGCGSRSGGFFRDGVPAHCATDRRAPSRDTERAMSQEKVELVRERSEHFVATALRLARSRTIGSRCASRGRRRWSRVPRRRALVT